MENSSEGPDFCGGFTYGLVYKSGPLMGLNALNTFSIEAQSAQNKHKVSGTPTAKNWIGTHVIAVVGTNGVIDNSPYARGNKGLFASVMSNDFTIEVTDPCLLTFLNPDGAFSIPDKFSVLFGEPVLIKQLDGPSDTISIKYGDGYDLCGARSYKIFSIDDDEVKTVYAGANFKINKDDSKALSGAELIELQLDSYRRGPVMTEQVEVEVKL